VALLTQAMEQTPATETADFRTLCHGFGTLYGKTGQLELTHAKLSTAITLYRAMEMTFWLPQAGAALAHVRAGTAPRAS
jgi:hypothetical protein